jgi:hypothetical protein
MCDPDASTTFPSLTNTDKSCSVEAGKKVFKPIPSKSLFIMHNERMGRRRERYAGQMSGQHNGIMT